jgi:hypothetical protein
MGRPHNLSWVDHTAYHGQTTQHIMGRPHS